MSIERKLIRTVDATSSAVYVEDVFSTRLYSGTGSSQTITNGIDLATKGGLVWIRGRSGATDHGLYDTARGATFDLVSNTTAAQTAQSTGLTAFGTTGFTIGSLAKLNTSAATYASWTFAKQAKFFDVVTYTGTGSARTISHALGATPGMIIVKRTDTTGNWQVYHRSLTSAANAIQLNLTNAQASATTVWNSTAPTSSVFSVGTDATVNASGGTYVAYLFADSNSGGFGPAGIDSVVACGSYTGNGSASGPTVSLGWEPQYILVKSSTGVTNWWVFDIMRGLSQTASNGLAPNTSAAEAVTSPTEIVATATGFSVDPTGQGYGSVNNTNQTYIYLAIRRGPMRTPTDATKVFSPNAVNVTTGTKITTGFPVDLQIYRPQRSSPGDYVYDRLRGVSTNSTDAGVSLATASTAAEVTTNSFTAFWDNTGYRQDAGWQNTSNIAWNFRRAPGFMDVVCWTGVGGSQTISHNLGVAPELIFVKRRNAVRRWKVYYGSATNELALNDVASFGSDFGAITATTFEMLGDNAVNTHVAYLFATCPGVSKVGSYTGNGSSQTIDCGFASGARFVLIKRTDAAGDWYVWDTARGIVSGNDPRLSLNTTAAEVTTDDSIDPASSGFIVNQLSATNINVSSATYIYLAIA